LTKKWIKYRIKPAMKTKFSGKHIILILFLFHTIASFVWMKIDTRPPSYDQEYHLSLSYDYLQIITHPSTDILKRILDISTYYPPVYHLLMVPFHLIFGFGAHNFIFINLFFLFLSIYSIWQIGKMLYSEEAGLLAAVVATSTPFWLFCLYTCLIEITLAGILTFSIYIYLKSDNFKNRKYSVILGLLFGIGALVKWTYAFFMTPALLYYLFIIFKELFTDLTPEKKRKFFQIAVLSILCCLFLVFMFPFIIGMYSVTYIAFLFLLIILLLSKTASDEQYAPLFNFIIMALMAWLIFGPWYLRHVFKLATKFLWTLSHAIEVEKDPDLFTFSALTYYIKMLGVQFSFFHYITLITGFIFLIYKRHKNNVRVLIWILPGIIVLTFLSNKDGRYNYPLIMLMTLLAVHWIVYINNKNTRTIITALITLISAVCFFTNAFFPFKFQHSLQYYIPTQPIYSAAGDNWKIQECINTIIANTDKSRGYSRTVLLANDAYFHKGAFSFYVKEKLPENTKVYFYSFEGRFTELTDFIIYKTGEKGLVNYPEQLKVVEEFENKAGYIAGNFKQILSTPLPDGTTAFIYKLQPGIYANKPCSTALITGKIKSELEKLGLKGDLSVEIKPISETETKKGIFKSVTITGKNIILQNLPIKNLSIKLADVIINMPALLEKDQLLFIHIGSLKPVLEIQGIEIRNLIRANNKEVAVEELTFTNGKLIFSGKIKGVPLGLAVKMKYNQQDAVLKMDVEYITLARVLTIPNYLYENQFSKVYGLKTSWDNAFDINVSALSLENDALKIN